MFFVLLCHTGQSRDIDVRQNYVGRDAKCSQDLIFVHSDIESGFKPQHLSQWRFSFPRSQTARPVREVCEMERW